MVQSAAAISSLHKSRHVHLHMSSLVASQRKSVSWHLERPTEMFGIPHIDANRQLTKNGKVENCQFIN